MSHFKLDNLKFILENLDEYYKQEKITTAEYGQIALLLKMFQTLEEIKAGMKIKGFRK